MQSRINEDKNTKPSVGLFVKPSEYFKSVEIVITISESKSLINYNFNEIFRLKSVKSGESKDSAGKHVSDSSKLLNELREKVFETYGEINYYFAQLNFTIVSESTEPFKIAYSNILPDVAKKEFDSFQARVSNMAQPKTTCVIQ